MKIFNPTYKSNKVIKIFSILPFFVFLMLLHGEGLFFNILSVLFFVLTMHTFFYAKQECYIDTVTRTVVKKIKWLFINNGTQEGLENYRAIVISIGNPVPNSSWQGATSKTTYDVVLVRKNSSSNAISGVGALENFLVGTSYNGIKEAKSLAFETAEKIGFPVESDMELIKFLKYDPVKHDSVCF